ncbi:hypothetical protein ACIPW5_29750 [Streptomyces sp. NPDC090077]|uniref:hypothetical protein n=1 Tax=Streptomyces sp. NPDC090077 TaxID=3365938 RepID=UPI0038071A68
MTPGNSERSAAQTQVPVPGERGIGALLLLVSLIPATVCWFVFAVQLPSDTGRLRDYTAAPPCAAGSAVQQGERCVRAVPFTVEEVRLNGGRGQRFTVTLTGGPSWRGKLHFGGPGPLLERLGPGDRVTGTVWQGAVMALAVGDVRQETAEEPRDEAQILAGFGTYTGLAAALGLWFGAARLTGRRRLYERHTWRGLGRPLLIAMAAICLAVAVTSYVLGIPWWAVPVVPTLLSAFTARQFDRYRRQQSAPA